MAPFIRIFLRYAAGALMVYGFIPEEIGSQIAEDPDIVQAIEVAVAGTVAAATEVWYWAARRFGWEK